MEKDALWHRSTLAARQGCILLPVSQGGDLGWKLDAMCGWAQDRGSRDVGWETSAGRAGWTGVGLDNKLAGCGLQDVGGSTVLRKQQCKMICNVEASCGPWLGAQTSRTSNARRSKTLSSNSYGAMHTAQGWRLRASKTTCVTRLHRTIYR